VEGQGLRVSALGPKELIGRSFKITIAEEEPVLLFDAYGDRAWARLQIAWNQSGLSPETVAKLTVNLQPRE
jgi:hypothetical protein